MSQGPASPRRRTVHPSIIERREAEKLAAPFVPKFSLLQTRFAFAKARLTERTSLHTALTEIREEATELRLQIDGLCAGEPKGSLADSAIALDRLDRLIDSELSGS